MTGSGGNDFPLWLVPFDANPTERLMSIGLSQSLQSLSVLETTPVATITPLNKNNNPVTEPSTLQCLHSIENQLAESETASLPDEIRRGSQSNEASSMDYVPDPAIRLAWTPAAPRRSRLHNRDYGSASSIDHYNPEYTDKLGNKYNQSQPFLLPSAEMSKENSGTKRRKTVFSYSRERLDNFVGKFSGSKQKLMEDEALDYRAVQQKKRREGTLSPRSNEYSYMLKKMANFGDDVSSTGYEGDGSEISSLSREQRYGNRRRWFAHYDCESTAFEFIPIAKLFDSNTKRSVIASGASAAIFTSALASEVGSEEELRRLQGTIQVDRGDGNSNLLVKSCPQFRNEIGGEVPLCIATIRPEVSPRGSHIPCVDGGKSGSLFEDVPRPQVGFIIECPNQGQDYYKRYFYSKDHSNYICEDDRFGPVCVSIIKEKQDERGRKEKSVYIYRIIVRTASLMVLKGSILEEMVPLGRNSYTVSHRDVTMHLLPEINTGLLRKLNSAAPELLINLDSKSEQRGLKIGILLCCSGQSTEEEMYNNKQSTPLFDQFLNILGKTIKLEDFEGFRAGLDVKGNSTGMESVYTSHRNYQIMFHVSTMLPYSTVNKQQVDRKRHIGNDVITIVFQEPGAGQFSPALSGVRSQFQHVFVIVRAHINTIRNEVRYSMSIARAKCVPSFGPDLPEGPVFTANDLFRDFILTKLINGHNSVSKVGKFGALGREMRFKYLKNLLENNVTESSSVEGSASRFSILPFRRVEKRRARIPAEIESRGGLIWCIEMLINDQLHSLVLGVSHEILCIVVPFDPNDGNQLDLVPGTAIFSIPPRSILGWTLLGELDIVIYFGKGDSFQFSLKRKQEIHDLIARLECSSRGKSGLYPPAIKTKEVNVTRPKVGGQLGFHVAYEGFVNQVDVGSAANKAGLLKGSRIVAIQAQPLSKLNHKEMINILRTDSRVSLRVLPPVGQKEQPRYTPRELANSVPRIPILSNEERDWCGEENDSTLELTLTQGESVTSILSEDQMISEIARSHAEIVSELKNEKVKMRTKQSYSPKRHLERKASFERKRKSFEVKRQSCSGNSEELPKVLSQEGSPVRNPSPTQRQPRAFILNDRTRSERRSWHGGRVSDSLTASDLMNMDRFESPSPTDTISSGERKSFRSPIKHQPKIKTDQVKRNIPKHVLSIKPRNEIIFFKASNSAINHLPSKRKENRLRNRSLPRASDKVTQDLLKLITEPITSSTTDEDQSPKKDNPEHLPEADRQCSLNNIKLSCGNKNVRRKSIQNPVTDERLHRIEKTLREMQIKLDEEQTRNHHLESEVKTLRHENFQMKITKTHRRQDYV